MKVKVLILISATVLIFFTKNDLNKIDNKNIETAYKGQMSNKTRVYSLMGMKKVGAGLMLLKQTANIGETFEGNKSFDIKKGSLEISELNPYYLDNYYAGANVLAFIKTYQDYEGAFEILNRGIEYNPNDEFLKKYSAGMIAGSKGNNDEVLKNYEKIVEKYPDPLMIKVIYDIYRGRVKNDRFYEEKYLHYAEILYRDKSSKYREFIERDLMELGYTKK